MANYTDSNSTAKNSSGDTISGNSTTSETLTIGGSTTGYINNPAVVGNTTVNDLDWFAVELVAGQRYQFDLDGNLAGGINDTVLTLFNSNSVAQAVSDDGGPGLYSQIIYTAPSTGTYYLQAAGFNGTVPSTGAYTLSAVTVTGTPSALTTLDWGTKLDVTTDTVIEVYFATNGEVFGGKTSIGWDGFESTAAMSAFNQFSNYIDVTFVTTTNQSAADFTLVQVASLGGSGLGEFNPPGTTNAGIGTFAEDGRGWDAAGLVEGGYGYITLVHEFAHGLGLAHPHDEGGTSRTMDGVLADAGDYGTYDLNQGVFTTMSYNDGWPTGPHGSAGSINTYGWQATAMALDIAVLQDKYGANTTLNSTNTTYTLGDTNAVGTFYSAIWDTGGVDEITFGGSLAVNIDLREATLLEEVGGGGYVSFATGIHGGYTIANGVVIENATGGSGADTLRGNDAANVLTGSGGNDFLFGENGQDTAHYNGSSADFTNLSYNNIIAVMTTGAEGRDLLDSIEQIEFLDTIINASSVAIFAENEYLASNTDVLTALGANGQAAFSHYVQSGFTEGRSLDNFDNFEYLASNADLLAVFGANSAVAAQHYVQNGFTEGRSLDSFDNFEYLASNADVLSALGADSPAAAQHYVQNGFTEGRSLDSFDNFEYLASNTDVLSALGADSIAATQHYVLNGFTEGRSVDSFDAAQYLNNYTDLSNAFGNDFTAATEHFVNAGYYEGRTDDVI